MITEEQYNNLLDHLYNKGIEDPEALIMEMSDEELIELVEGFKPLDHEKEGLVHNKLDHLQRDMQVSHARIKELKRKPFSKFRPKVQAELQSVAKSALKKGNLAKNAATALIRTNNDKIEKSHEREANIRKQIDTISPNNNIRRLTREEFDCLLDYLLDEGYATDVKSGIKIVDCMSEEWAADVLEEKYVRGVSVGKKKGKGSDGQGPEENQRKRESTLSGGFRSKRGERREGRDNARGGFR